MLDPRLQYMLLCAAIIYIWYMLNRRLARSAADSRRSWQPTTGCVVRVRHTDKGDLPVVNYYIRGEAVRGALCHLRWADSRFREGQAVSILYDPDHPDHILLRRQAEHDGELGRLFYVGLVALCFLLLSKYYFAFIL